MWKFNENAINLGQWTANVIALYAWITLNGMSWKKPLLANKFGQFDGIAKLSHLLYNNEYVLLSRCSSFFIQEIVTDKIYFSWTIRPLTGTLGKLEWKLQHKYLEIATNTFAVCKRETRRFRGHLNLDKFAINAYTSNAIKQTKKEAIIVIIMHRNGH